jgi:hypothetical protein
MLSDAQKERIAERVLAGEHPAEVAFSMRASVPQKDRVDFQIAVIAYAKQVQADFGEGVA